jgi:hypothetical protein
MTVNINKTSYIIFHSKGKTINMNDKEIYFNNNEIGKPVDPNLIKPLTRIHANHVDPSMRSYKSLGIYLDETLTFDKQTTSICSKIARSIFCIKRASNLLSLKALKSLYYAMIHPHLLYCINIVSCTSQTNINRILLLQKKAIRIISKEKYNSHTNPIFKKLGILPYNLLIKQANLNLMHSIEYKYAQNSLIEQFPKNLSRDTNHELRNANDFIVPFARTESFKKIPLFSLPKIWNEEIGDLRLQHNKITFQIALKDHLLDSLS